MKKSILFIVLSLLFFMGVTPKTSNFVQAEEENKKAKLAIVIDDFGMDRRGVEEMLALDIPLTVAVLPGLDYSVEDAKKAHAKGHEVILHMPMENISYMPPEYYGPVVIRNAFTKEQAKETFIKAYKSIPHAVGANIHMGTGVSQNEELLTAIMEEAKKMDAYFLDSKTIMGSKCPESAKRAGVKFYERDFFLEPPGRPSYATAKSELLKAAEHAVKSGTAVAIGHIGPVGDVYTARAIKDSIETIKEMGVEIVPLSNL